MKSELFSMLFTDNPQLPQAIFRFCQSLPEYRRAREDYQRAAEELQSALGFARYNRFEQALNRLWAEENRAYYLFGLQLRQTVLKALAAGEDEAG